MTPLPPAARAEGRDHIPPFPTWTALGILAGAALETYLVDFLQLINTPLPSSVPLANKLSEATFPHFKAL